MNIPVAAQPDDPKQPPAEGGKARIRMDDPEWAYAVLIADLLGLRFGGDGKPDHSEIQAYIEGKGGFFHLGPLEDRETLEKGSIHFFYQPDLSTEAEILPQTDKGQYDALIAAATFIPKASVFRCGGVRIGAGTGNMGSASWGGGDGDGGTAPLMNTPGINSLATAQMVMKAILKVAPDLPVDELRRLAIAGQFDTGKHLSLFPTEKLEGKRIAVLGYGNIGREVARLARAFGLRVAVYARERNRTWIESEGFDYAATPPEAARGADFITCHLGLGKRDGGTGRYSNAGLIGETVLDTLNRGAVVVNYDRGELIDVPALDHAMASGKVRHAAIDADIFLDPVTGGLSGPLAAYLPLDAKYPGRLELLPHAAADTDHPSRVAGARQAVDQIFNAIRFREVTNLKGNLPEGYTNAGSKSPSGIGKVTMQQLAGIAQRTEIVNELRQASEKQAEIWNAIAMASDPDDLKHVLEGQMTTLITAANRQRALLEDLGLYGPAEE